jgi:hypothetical protein
MLLTRLPSNGISTGWASPGAGHAPAAGDRSRRVPVGLSCGGTLETEEMYPQIKQPSGAVDLRLLTSTRQERPIWPS